MRVSASSSKAATSGRRRLPRRYASQACHRLSNRVIRWNEPAGTLRMGWDGSCLGFRAGEWAKREKGPPGLSPQLPERAGRVRAQGPAGPCMTPVAACWRAERTQRNPLFLFLFVALFLLRFADRRPAAELLYEPPRNTRSSFRARPGQYIRLSGCTGLLVPVPSAMDRMPGEPAGSRRPQALEPAPELAADSVRPLQCK